MTKAIVLTQVSINNEEKELLKNTKVYKIAINQHADELNPDIRICSDWNSLYLLNNFKQKVITIRETPRHYSDRLIQSNLTFKGATIISAVEWLMEQGYDDVLIVGDNSVNSPDFQKNVNENLFSLLLNEPKLRLSQYSNGNFLLPIISIKEFLREQKDE